MKTNLLKYYIAALYFCSTLVMIAQSGPGTGTDDGKDGGLDGLDEPAASVDGYVWVLAAIGLIYVFLRVRAFAQQENIPQE
jgi:hypothetical protein